MMAFFNPTNQPTTAANTNTDSQPNTMATNAPYDKQFPESEEERVVDPQLIDTDVSKNF
jgi:hypothetical protein